MPIVLANHVNLKTLLIDQLNVWFGVTPRKPGKPVNLVNVI